MTTPKSTGPRDYLKNVRHYVYRHFDEQGQALYVGCAQDVLERHKDRRRMGVAWIGRIAKTKVTVHPGRDEARAVEQSEIRRLEPLHNGEVNFMDTHSWDRGTFFEHALALGIDKKRWISPQSALGLLGAAYANKFGGDLSDDLENVSVAV